MTSLSEQLQKLSAPQTEVYKDDKKKASLLFDPKEAALKDRDTFYEIGLSGLKELISLYEGFRIFEDSLFSMSSKDFERAVQSKEINQQLDETIEKFLLQLSPYLLLQSSHKVLEWLVNRYYIHQYNQNAIMALILPYHETKIFVRFIQLFDLKSETGRWHWLKPLQKPGIPLTKQVLYNQCASNSSTLKFIAKNTLKYVEEFGQRASQLNTVYAFFCSVSIGTINSARNVTETIINAILPTLYKGLDSPIADFGSASYVILGYMSSKITLKISTFEEIVYKMITADFDLPYDMVLLINLLYTHQKHMTCMSNKIVFDMTSYTMGIVCGHLKKLVEMQINIQPFVLAYLNGVLPVIQSDEDNFRNYCQLPEMLIDEVNLKQQNPQKIIRAILNAYKSHEQSKSSDGNESDLEIVEENQIVDWYSGFLKSIETKYPEEFDNEVKLLMNSDNKIYNVTQKKKLKKVLAFKPAVAHKIGDAYLFENLNHVNPEFRTKAVKYIATEFKKLKNENVNFVRESILDRLTDDNIKVVKAALEIPIRYLAEVMTEIDLTNAFIKILSRGQKWTLVIQEAVVKFCSLDKFAVNQETVLAILPHLFPSDSEAAKVAWKVISSSWGKKTGLEKVSKEIGASFTDNSDVISQAIFKALFKTKSVSFDTVLDITLLDKKNILNVCVFSLLKSCTFETASTEDMTIILSLVLESIENNAIISNPNISFSSNIVSEIVATSKNNQILFEYLEYIFSKIVDGMNIKDIPKPWCNVCASPDLILLKRLYEIFLTGCCIRTYEENYARLLRKLLGKYFVNSKEIFEFISNIACGHFLYAPDPSDVINPELQIRSIRLLTNFVAAQDAPWISDSDVVILTILFNLNNPLPVIRECTIEFATKILNNFSDEKQVYMHLLEELLSHKAELSIDHEQIPLVLHTILNQTTPSSKVFRRNCQLKLMGILLTDIPAHILAEYLKILSNFDSANIFNYIVPSLHNVEKIMKDNILQPITFDVYESKLITNVYGRINENTIATLTKDAVWNTISTGLKEYRECVLQDLRNYISPSVLIMKQIDEDVFKKVPEEKRKYLVYLIVSAGTFSNNPNIASVASKTMKKLNIEFAHFKEIFDKMLNATDPATNAPKKKKSTVSMLSHQLVETNDWRLGITMLEYVQSKKKMIVDNGFVSTLFQLLNKCLRFEEQSYVEYTKQLILSSLWYYCKKFVDDKDKDQIKTLKSTFDIELVVQCIRGTQNPQTHHHALILLSHAAFMLPEQVLHHTMEIFTFMGSSVLRHDDAYSFQIITKIIETLIPILVKLDKDVDEYSEKELQLLQNRVVPVLRIFADVVLHVPEHRRLPLYKKLLNTLGPSQFLWILIALLLETHIAHFNENKEKEKRPTKTLADKESPINRLDFGQSILLEFTPEIGMENFIKLMLYLKTLPLQKDEESMETDVDPSEIFSVNAHSPLQLRHYKYILITFMNTCLASPRFIQHASQASDVKAMEGYYKTFIINILTFVQSISKISDEKTAKYWRVMLHHSYDLLDHTNNLLSAPMFLSVIKGLLKHTLQTVQRKSMEILNNKIQFSPEMFADVDKQLLYALLPALVDIIKTLDRKDDNLNEAVAQEVELNQQTALLSLKLLTRMLAQDDPEPFKPVLEMVTDYTCNPNISGNVMASIVLCLAELCGNLKAHALASLRKFMPALIKVLKKQRKSDTTELVLLSTITALSKIVESLPLFLSPYLQKILYEYALLYGKWQNEDQDCNKVSAVVGKLCNIKKKIATSIPPRVLIPVAHATHQLLLDKENYDAIGPVMAVLADSFRNITPADFTALQQDLTSFFLTALQLRSDAVEKDVDDSIIDRTEDEIVNALVSLVLKLSESSFRPFYFKIYDWAIRTNIEGHKDRAITFYRVSSAIADKLKGLFVLFAGHFIKNASELLEACNVTKSEELYFSSENKCITLIHYIIKTLHTVFLYDSQNFLNKDRFETLMQPVVDQLENPVGGILRLKERAKEIIIPCVTQLAVATADDSLWKLLNYQVLLKTRHNEGEIRLLALDTLVSMATALGSSWLPLLAESVPFLAELLEDGDQNIENATKRAVRELEQILGEPLEKYF